MTHIPTEEEIGLRLDAFVAGREELTRSAIQKLIEKGNVRVNDLPSKKSYRIEASDVIEIELPEPEEISVTAEDIALDIVYEDSDLIVVNKPKGMVVHPAPGNYSGTLVNALMFHCKDSLSGINGEIRPGIVHRIDKDTSGLLVIAKNDAAHNSLAYQIKEHSCERTYEAIVVGNIKEDEGTVDAPIARHPTDRKKMAIVAGGRSARTHWQVINRYEGYTHLRLRLETGRTHQIRVHMASIGHPVFCDGVYGGLHTKTEILNASKINGQCLHARTLGFAHPKSGERMVFESELPEYFSALLGKLILK
ncbi:MAG: RluA family pseudouridine synthase [Clostridia bacterium]|nr:RluA family pseudouridine synthase [Clostridia bacterium]